MDAASDWLGAPAVAAVVVVLLLALGIKGVTISSATKIRNQLQQQRKRQYFEHLSGILKGARPFLIILCDERIVTDAAL